MEPVLTRRLVDNEIKTPHTDEKKQRRGPFPDLVQNVVNHVFSPRASGKNHAAIGSVAPPWGALVTMPTAGPEKLTTPTSSSMACLLLDCL